RTRGYSSYDFASNARAFAPSGLICKNKWPPDAHFTREIKRFNRRLCAFTQRVSKDLFNLIDDTFTSTLPYSALTGTTCSMTRFLLYEATDIETVSKAHTDYEFSAIIICDGPGLEVQRADASWAPVSLDSGRCILLPGDMAALASGGQITATRHRVT